MNKNVHMIASPESLTLSPWSELVTTIMQKRTLSFVCVDEVYLFVNFAISFRQSFLLLKTTLFDKLQSTSQHLTVPAIFMTATLNNKLLQLLTKITNYKFQSSNAFLSTSSEFSRRNVSIDISMPSLRFHTMKKYLM